MQTSNPNSLALQYFRLAREILRRVPEAQVRVIPGPYRIMFRWEQQLSDNSVWVWDRVIKNRYAWRDLWNEMQEIAQAEKENDIDAELDTPDVA